MSLLFKNFIIFIVLFFLAPTYAIPGFSYKISCKNALEFKNNSIEAARKILTGNTWPEGAKANLSLMEFNMLDMVEYGKGNDRDLGRSYIAKPLAQLEGIARVLNKYRPMLVFCVEIGSVKVLKDYDRDFLGNQYEEFLIEGNDKRGIHVGLLVRKDLPLAVEVHTHKNLIENSSGHEVFSRDLPVYILREKAANKPLLIIFGTHFKSQRDLGDDVHGFKKRSLQAEATSLLIADYEKQFPNTPIVLTGDFNNDVRTSPEFNSIKQLGMVDSFEVALDSVEKGSRGTHYYFPKRGRPSISQLDSIMLNQVAIKQVIVKMAKVLSHIDENGNALPAPQSYRERQQRASDHLPIIAIFDLSLN